jgi:hypothetical protein
MKIILMNQNSSNNMKPNPTTEITIIIIRKSEAMIRESKIPRIITIKTTTPINTTKTMTLIIIINFKIIIFLLR